ncbi:hypothetical protein IEQ34_023343 [Dendrobium chrysotoxum]|uniref:Cytochrome c assembly protein domain-containing protein n=1 Tax=Dendrobium chrysotoxum TaxID=161865 RepID=A0AAV7FPC5_DENCH|nr:hypothetical protein IEQ34_025590 [Dendrobium chrysotoxum]KAH0445437.1 hypothetical protein IEQ34_025478 [Dendrobium chrysotoxum]KAH0445509.1 hypothetical protein IEQ34_025412 [Dendrobium chrysotoxum]KAH0445520.1 hypothetical protein IEQ34_025364 [Dendrobium chrysotoxum]KAH0446190.1 hypothetical protein IEQ34_024984 [Dendrobium chrysotoxum]
MIPYLGNHKNDFSAITAPSAIFTQGFATSGLSTEMHQPAILVPALQSQWLMMHRLDYWSYRVISLGFTFFTIGILSGAVWANEAWVSYWNWDPKETWAFLTWTIFAISLHTRTNPKLQDQGTNSAFVASIGFLLIWICYFGINLLGIGFHSYGSFQ